MSEKVKKISSKTSYLRTTLCPKERIPVNLISPDFHYGNPAVEDAEHEERSPEGILVMNHKFVGSRCVRCSLERENHLQRRKQTSLKSKTSFNQSIIVIAVLFSFLNLFAHHISN